jgi:hypothetical protein
MFAQWGAASLSEVHTDAADSLMGVAKANKRRIVALEAQLKVRERDQPPHQAPTLVHAPWTSAHGPVGCPRGSAPAAVRGRRNPPPPWLREGSSPGEGVGRAGRTGQALNSALSEKDQQTDDMRKRLKARDAEVARMREEAQKAAVATQRAEAAAGVAAGAEAAVRYTHTHTHTHTPVGLVSPLSLTTRVQQ